MNSVVKLETRDVNAIPFQEASLDIWDKKYRLSSKDGQPIDGSMDDTYKRVARALADVEREEQRESWYERFLWALRHGAIPEARSRSSDSRRSLARSDTRRPGRRACERPDPSVRLAMVSLMLPELRAR